MAKPKPVDPTKATYDALTKAYAHFNKTLFDGRLPPVMLVIHRKRNAHGYFWREQWAVKGDKKARLDEIALNPETMGRSVEEVLSTLVHEMVHQEQHCFGKPGKGHNREWADMMERVGLTPSTTGKPGGKRTGRKCSHYIEEGGRFATECAKLVAKGVDLTFFTQPQIGGAKKKDPSKAKQTCPHCAVNLWAKQGTRFMCGECDELMVEA